MMARRNSTLISGWSYVSLKEAGLGIRDTKEINLVMFVKNRWRCLDLPY